jgi:hypothetical protein
MEKLKGWVGDTFLKYVFLGIAVELAYKTHSQGFVNGLIHRIYPIDINQQHFVSIVSTLIYMLVAFIATTVYKMQHTKHEICGRYVSLPKGDGSLINIFDIKSAGFISTEYQLICERYSISGGAAVHTGGWHAKTLDITPCGSDIGVIYLYFGDKTEGGTPKDDTFQGHGLTKLILRGTKLDSGDGHWVDDENPPGRHDTSYFKVSYGNLPNLLLANRPWYRKFPTRFPWSMRDIADAYAKLPPDSPLRKRPARAL